MTAQAKPGRLLSADEAIDHIQGPATAPVTVIEYGDFECPSCFQAYTALKVMLPHFDANLRLVFRHFPLREVHAHAELAAEAAEAALAAAIADGPDPFIGDPAAPFVWPG